MSDGKTSGINGKSQRFNVQDVKITYPVDELMNCISDEKAFGCEAKYYACPKLMEDLQWSLN